MDFLGGFLCNCLSYFLNARITFTCILYPQCTHMIFIIFMYTLSHSSYNGYELNSHLTCFQRGCRAQLVEHRTGIAGSNPVEASFYFILFYYFYFYYFYYYYFIIIIILFFWGGAGGVLCNCENHFSFICIFYPQCM